MRLVVQLLVEQGGNPCVGEVFEETPFSIAACAGCWQNIGSMLTARLEYLKPQALGAVLNMAYGAKQHELVIKLIEKGAALIQPEDGRSIMCDAIFSQNWRLVEAIVRHVTRDGLQASLKVMNPSLRCQLIQHFSVQPEAEWAVILRSKGILLDEPGLPERGFPVDIALTVADNPQVYTNAAHFLQFVLRFQHELVLHVFRQIESYELSGQWAVAHAETFLLREDLGLVDLMSVIQLIRLIAHTMTLSTREGFDILVARADRIRGAKKKGASKYIAVCRLIHELQDGSEDGEINRARKYVLEKLDKIKREFERTGRSEVEGPAFEDFLEALNVEHKRQSASYVAVEVAAAAEEIDPAAATVDTDQRTIKQLLGEELFGRLRGLAAQLIGRVVAVAEDGAGGGGAAPVAEDKAAIVIEDRKAVSIFRLQSKILSWKDIPGDFWWKKLSIASSQSNMFVPVSGVIRQIQAMPLDQQVPLLLQERDGYCVIKDKNLFGYFRVPAAVHLMHAATQQKNWDGLCLLEDMVGYMQAADESLLPYYQLARVICQLMHQLSLTIGEPAESDQALLTELQAIFQLKVADCTVYEEERLAAKESGATHSHEWLAFPTQHLTSYLGGIDETTEHTWNQMLGLAGVDLTTFVGGGGAAALAM